MPSRAIARARRRRETRAALSLRARSRRSAALRSWRIGRDTIAVARDKVSPDSQNHNLNPIATCFTPRVTILWPWYNLHQGGGGTKLGLTRPWRTRSAVHSASL